MKKLFSALLLAALLLTAGCNLIGGESGLKSNDYIYNQAEMTKVKDQITKQSNNNKIVGKTDINVNNFSSKKGVKTDGTIRFKILDSENPQKITEHFFTPPSDWRNQAGQKYDKNLI